MQYYKTEKGLIDYQKTLSNIGNLTKKMSDKEFKKEARAIIKRAQSRVSLLTGKQKAGKYKDLAAYVPAYAKSLTSGLAGLNRQGIMQKLKVALRILAAEWSTVEGAKKVQEKRKKKREAGAKTRYGLTPEEYTDPKFWELFRAIEELTGWYDDSMTLVELTKIAYREDVPIDKVAEVYFQREQEKWDAYMKMWEEANKGFNEEDLYGGWKTL